MLKKIKMNFKQFDFLNLLTSLFIFIFIFYHLCISTSSFYFFGIIYLSFWNLFKLESYTRLQQIRDH